MIAAQNDLRKLPNGWAFRFPVVFYRVCVVWSVRVDVTDYTEEKLFPQIPFTNLT